MEKYWGQAQCLYHCKQLGHTSTYHQSSEAVSSKSKWINNHNLNIKWRKSLKKCNEKVFLIVTLIWSCKNLTYCTASSSMVLISTYSFGRQNMRIWTLTNYGNSSINRESYLSSIGDKTLQYSQPFIYSFSSFLHNPVEKFLLG